MIKYRTHQTWIYLPSSPSDRFVNIIRKYVLKNIFTFHCAKTKINKLKVESGAKSSKQCSMYYAIENVQTLTAQISFNLQFIRMEHRKWQKQEKTQTKKLYIQRILNERIMNPSWPTKGAGKVYILYTLNIEWMKKILNWISKQYTNWTMLVQCKIKMHHEQEYYVRYVLWFICFFFFFYAAIDARSILDTSPFQVHHFHIFSFDWIISGRCRQSTITQTTNTICTNNNNTIVKSQKLNNWKKWCAIWMVLISIDSSKRSIWLKLLNNTIYM